MTMGRRAAAVGLGLLLAGGVGYGVGRGSAGAAVQPWLQTGQAGPGAPAGNVVMTTAPDPDVPRTGRTPAEQITINVARRASPAVVSVLQPDGSGSGSGIIVQADGVVLTNAHVVGDARRVQIGLADGRLLDGQVLGGDPSVDVAVVRVNATGLPTAVIGDADRLEVGQVAIAIGNPLGLDRTVTSGVVSAVNRNPRGFGLDGLIQTDAAISPGNSGGPLLDSEGRVIGLNTAVLRAPGAEGLGFAIPIGLANDVARQVLETGRVQRAFLGVSFRDIDSQLAAQFGLPVRQGVIVAAVGEGTPAARAGIQPGDIITGISGTAIAQGGDLRRLLRDLKPGHEVTLAVRRPSGTSRVRVRLAEAPPL